MGLTLNIFRHLYILYKFRLQILEDYKFLSTYETRMTPKLSVMEIALVLINNMQPVAAPSQPFLS